jgi:hypothetical protein
MRPEAQSGLRNNTAGLTTSSITTIIWGPRPAEQAIPPRQARLTAHGALAAKPGAIPAARQDKHIVRDATASGVWWDNNRAMSPATACCSTFQQHLAGATCSSGFGQWHRPLHGLRTRVSPNLPAFPVHPQPADAPGSARTGASYLDDHHRPAVVGPIRPAMAH